MTPAVAYPPAVRRGLVLVRGGLIVAGASILTFLASYALLGPAGAAGREGPGLWLAWGSIFAWSAGMVVALVGRWLVRRGAEPAGGDAQAESGAERGDTREAE